MGCQVSEKFSCSNATQTSCLAGRVSATITANTTTAVSTVRTKFYDGHVVQHVQTCSIMRLSASSMLHGPIK